MVAMGERLRGLLALAIESGGDERARQLVAEELRDILEADLSPEQRAIANDIAVQLARDVANAVRRTLVMRLHDCRFLPREAAMRLARDIETRSEAFLAASPAFSDQDLIELAGTLDPQGLRSLAARTDLPQEATLHIAERGDQEAAAMLSRNTKADLIEPVYDVLISRFASVTDLMDSLAARHDAPLTILKRLLDVISDAVRDHLVSEHALGPDLAAYLAEDTRRHSLVAMMNRAADRQVEKLVRNLDGRGEITPVFLLYAMEQGATRIFEMVLAVRNNISIDQVRLTIQDPDSRRIMRLVDRAQLGESMLKEYRKFIRRHQEPTW